MSLGRLVILSVGGLGACIGMGLTFHKLFISKIMENPIYLEAMETVKKHEGTIHFLGEPIESKSPVLANKGMLLSGYSDIQVRVIGPKAQGIVFLKVVGGEEQNINVQSIHLQIGKDQSKRLLIKDKEKERNIPEIQEDKEKERNIPEIQEVKKENSK